MTIESDTILQHEVLAIEKGVSARAGRVVTDLHKMLQKSSLLEGGVREYEKKDDAGEDLPREHVRVQLQAEDAIESAREAWCEYWDVEATKDWGNTQAQADVVLDGKTIITSAPVTFLLFLEKQLHDLQTFIAKIPTLDPSFEWERDPNSRQWRSNKVRTHRTNKLQKPITLAPATDKHPAQTQLITVDEIVGFWNAHRLSGALPMPEKEAMLKRVAALSKAVRSARAKGNTYEVARKQVAGAMLSYIFDGA